jgi:nitroreductase
VKEPDLKKKLSKATPYSGHAAFAPLVLVLVADMGLARRWVEDLSIAAAHIMLEATELGYGTCFVQVRESSLNGKNAEGYVKEVLGVPEGFNVLCMVTMGKSSEDKPVHNKNEFEESRIHSDRW